MPVRYSHHLHQSKVWEEWGKKWERRGVIKDAGNEDKNLPVWGWIVNHDDKSREDWLCQKQRPKSLFQLNYRVFSGNWQKLSASFSAYEASLMLRKVTNFPSYMYILILGFQKIQIYCHFFQHLGVFVALNLVYSWKMAILGVQSDLNGFEFP